MFTRGARGCFALAWPLAACALLAACVAAPPPQPTIEAPVDAAALNRRLGRGVNLGNALEAPTEGEWGLVLEEDYFRLIAEAGFTAVRLPVRWNAHAAAEPPYTIAPEFFERVDWAVEQALSRGLVIVVNIHHYEELTADPSGQAERFAALWQQIATHYQGYPSGLALELLNEPSGHLTAKRWNELVATALPVVRAADPARTVVVGPADYNSFRALPDLELPEGDRHLIVTFHYYEPFQFTHQGAEWVDGSDAWLGTEWAGTRAQGQTIEYHFDTVAQWAAEHDRPIFLGEFGAYSKADLQARARWTTFVARAAEERGFSWAYWEFGSSFGVYDPAAGAWNDPLRLALLPAQ